MREVLTIDCDYLERPRMAAAYLVVDGDRAAFVENNTAHAVPRMLRVLRDAGLEPEQVEYAIITHVHLDHAGGTSALMEACPRATLVAHPRAARHVIDPSRLVASATEVYGEETFERLYGRIDPVPESRVRTMEDGETLTFGSRELTFFHTRGHANHHFCVYDSGSQGIFTGDAFGLVYPDLQRNGLLAFPSTSPTDFIADEAKKAVRRIADWGAERVYLTHFGEHEPVGAIAEQLLEELEFSGALEREAYGSSLPDDELEAFCRTRIRGHFEERLRAYGDLAEDPDAWALLELDIELNAQGLAFAAAKSRRKAREVGVAQR